MTVPAVALGHHTNPRPRDAAALVESVVLAVDAWAEGGDMEADDLTIVAVCRAPGGGREMG